MKTRVTIIAVLFVFAFVALGSAALAENVKTRPSDSTKAESEVEKQAPDSSATTVIAYYFHGTRRCVTCKKLEAYSKEAVESGFAEQLKSGKIQWRSVNTDEAENTHFRDDYQLYTKSVILSEMKNGEEIKWKNLDKIWQLVRGEKAVYLKYIRDEV
ncbi:MAG: hypothetical protein JSV80_08915, partial [Acidobacteriota bacterium]